MSPSETRGGYLFVALCMYGQVERWRLNRLILATFLGNEPHLIACHVNGDNIDNRLSNLYWGTAEQNAQDAIRHGAMVKGERKPESVLTDELVMKLRELWHDPKRVMGPVPLGRMFGVSGPTAWRAATGKTWTHLPMPDQAKESE